MDNSSSRPRFNHIAKHLAQFLDETKLYTRQEWASLLRVRPAALSQWVHGRTLPSPEHLRMILDALEWHSSTPARVLERFSRLLDQPASRLVGRPQRLRTTLGEYMLSPMRERTLNGLSSLGWQAQSQLLTSLGHTIQMYRDYPTQDVHDFPAPDSPNWSRDQLGRLLRAAVASFEGSPDRRTLFRSLLNALAKESRVTALEYVFASHESALPTWAVESLPNLFIEVSGERVIGSTEVIAWKHVIAFAAERSKGMQNTGETLCRGTLGRIRLPQQDLAVVRRVGHYFELRRLQQQLASDGAMVGEALAAMQDLAARTESEADTHLSSALRRVHDSYMKAVIGFAA